VVNVAGAGLTAGEAMDGPTMAPIVGSGMTVVPRPSLADWLTTSAPTATSVIMVIVGRSSQAFNLDRLGLIVVDVVGTRSAFDPCRPRAWGWVSRRGSGLSGESVRALTKTVEGSASTSACARTEAGDSSAPHN